MKNGITCITQSILKSIYLLFLVVVIFLSSCKEAGLKDGQHIGGKSSKELVRLDIDPDSCTKEVICGSCEVYLINESSKDQKVTIEFIDQEIGTCKRKVHSITKRIIGGSSLYIMNTKIQEAKSTFGSNCPCIDTNPIIVSIIEL